MKYNYAAGAQEDFNNMTKEMGKEVFVMPRKESLEYEGYEGEERNVTDNPMSAKSIIGKKETVFLQELNSKHEVIQAGLFKLGDVRFNFLSNSSVEEEGYVIDGKKTYKVLRLTKYEDGDTITDIRAYGKKMPNR